MEEATRNGYLAASGAKKGAAALGEGDSAKAAQRAYHNMQRFVLLLQLQQVWHCLCRGTGLHSGRRAGLSQDPLCGR